MHFDATPWHLDDGRRRAQQRGHLEDPIRSRRFVEIIGLPGSGKSTQTALLLEWANEVGLATSMHSDATYRRSSDIVGRSIAVANIVRAHPLFSWTIGAYCARTKFNRPIPAWRAFSKIMGSLYWLSAGAARSPAPLVIADEAPLQMLWKVSVPGRQDGGAIVRKIARRIVCQSPFDEWLTIWLQLTPQQASDRIRQRQGCHRFDRMSEVEVVRTFEAHSVVIDHIVDGVADCGRASIMCIDATRDRHVVCADICSALWSWAQSKHR